MKAIVTVLLLVAATFATEMRMFDQKSGEITHFYTKNSAEGGMRSRDLGGTIIDGQEAFHGQFPWQVFIAPDRTERCGGSLISPGWVLTAAHCVNFYQHFTIFCGAHNPFVYEPASIRLETMKKIFHEDYDYENQNNDIALLELPTEVPITEYINVIQLPSYSMTDESIFGKDATISGWGMIHNDSKDVSHTLQYAEVTVLNHLECKREIPKYNSTTMLCTRNGFKSVCRGDSGGPLLIWKDRKPIQIGVVSYVIKNECEMGKPSYYARVFNYLKWISMKTGNTFIGGKYAFRGQLPWQVFIIPDRTHTCGGSLISPGWVLTAAHCVNLYQQFLLHFGVGNLQDVSERGWKRLTASRKIFHEDFDNKTKNNDIALLELPSEVPITVYIDVIQLPSYSMTDESIFGEDATISGWGLTKGSEKKSHVLQYAEVTVLNHLECKREYSPYNSTTMLCTRNEFKNACKGDSGGPLVIWKDSKPIQVGVVSYVIAESCEIGKPSYYARVFNYLKWISTKTGIIIKP